MSDPGARVADWQREVGHLPLCAEESLVGAHLEHATVGELNLVTGALWSSDDEQWAERGQQRSLGNAS
jgi:hypothetical protein